MAWNGLSQKFKNLKSLVWSAWTFGKRTQLHNTQQGSQNRGSRICLGLLILSTYLNIYLGQPCLSYECHLTYGAVFGHFNRNFIMVWLKWSKSHNLNHCTDGMNILTQLWIRRTKRMTRDSQLLLQLSGRTPGGCHLVATPLEASGDNNYQQLSKSKHIIQSPTK